MKKKTKKINWKSVEVHICGKNVTGIKSIQVEEKGLEVDKTLGLQPVLKITDSETGKEVK